MLSLNSKTTRKVRKLLSNGSKIDCSKIKAMIRRSRLTRTKINPKRNSDHQYYFILINSNYSQN